MTLSGAIANGMSHIEVTVRDLDRSLAFYRDLLGLRVVQEGTSSDRAFPNAAGLRIYSKPTWEFRFAVLQSSREPAPFGPGASTTIVLLCALEAASDGQSIKADQIGITHFGLWVSGLDAVCHDLEARGATCLEPPHTMTTTPDGTVRSAFFQDPDGIIVQLDELVPAGA